MVSFWEAAELIQSGISESYLMPREAPLEIPLDPIVSEFGQGNYMTFTLVIDDPRLEYEPETG